jgi:hypothetical protein
MKNWNNPWHLSTDDTITGFPAVAADVTLHVFDIKITVIQILLINPFTAEIPWSTKSA